VFERDFDIFSPYGSRSLDSYSASCLPGSYPLEDRLFPGKSAVYKKDRIFSLLEYIRPVPYLSPAHDLTDDDLF